MNVVLLGGFGFIGKYLVEEMLNFNNINIIVVDRNCELSNKKNDKIIYRRLNLELRTKEYEDIIFNSDIIIILIYPNKKIIDNLCQIAKNSINLKRIFYLSTSLIYSNFNFSKKKIGNKKIKNSYVIDKHNEENYLYNFVHSFHKKLLIARLGNVYGDIKNKGIVNNIFNSILNNTKLEIRGDGNQKRDFIFVDDVANLIVKLIFTEQKEEKVVYNICSGISSSINNLIYEIEFLLNTKIDYHYIDFEFEKCDVICNNKKILDLLGKNYMFSNLSIGLKKTAKRYGLKKRF